MPAEPNHDLWKIYFRDSTVCVLQWFISVETGFSFGRGEIFARDMASDDPTSCLLLSGTASRLN